MLRPILLPVLLLVAGFGTLRAQVNYYARAGAVAAAEQGEKQEHDQD